MPSIKQLKNAVTVRMIAALRISSLRFDQCNFLSPAWFSFFSGWIVLGNDRFEKRIKRVKLSFPNNQSHSTIGVVFGWIKALKHGDADVKLRPHLQSCLIEPLCLLLALRLGID